MNKSNRAIEAAARQRYGANGRGVHAAPPPARGTPGRLAVSNWPVAQRLFVVIVLAAAMGLIFGSLQVASAISRAAQYTRVSHLAKLGQQGLILASDLEDERTAAAVALSSGTGTGANLPTAMAKWWGTRPTVRKDGTRVGVTSVGVTNADAAKFSNLAGAIDNTYPASTQQLVSNVVDNVITVLPGLRSTVQSTVSVAPAGGQLNAITDYSQAIGTIFQMNDVIAQDSGDTQLINDVHALDSLSRAQDQVSQERGLLSAAFTNYLLNKGTYLHSLLTAEAIAQVVLALNTAQSEQYEFIGLFYASASPALAQQLESALDSRQNAQVGTDELFVIQEGSLDLAPLGTSAADWQQVSGSVVANYGQVDSSLMQAIVDRSQALQAAAERTAWETGVLTTVVFLLILLAALFVARTLVLPLRRLQAGALDIAQVSLPERVKALAEAADTQPPLELAPINVLSTDEIGQVARAFDLVHREALRLAGNEAMLRGSLNAMFVSLSRRSQTLIERLSRMIDTLELNEDDPDRLSSLFAMDHMITRMRRNSENLLVLAGHEGARKRSDPVLLGDVARAATSEIEQYGRVVLNVQSGIEVNGQASTDIVHLLAELIENATLYSPRTTDVYVNARELTTGGVLVEIADNGVGISESRLEQLNWRLENPPVVDVSVSRHMGLFAVSHLAARHGVAVRLRTAAPRGMVAMVWLPGTVAGRSTIGYGERLRRMGAGHTTLREGSASQAYAQLKYGDLRSQETVLGISEQSVSPQGTLPQGTLPQGTLPQGTFPQGTPARGNSAGLPAGQSASNWFRPRQESGPVVRSSGWRTPQPAEAPEPVTAGLTGAGLPLRVPRGNSASGYPVEEATIRLSSPSQRATQASRSPEAARSRLSGFQHGARRAESQVSGAGEGTDR